MGRLELRLADEEKERFTQAAKRKGLSLSAWIRLTCIEALDRGAEPAPRPPKARKPR
jgi:hypothetical protein